MTATRSTHRSTIQFVATLFGATFLLVGVLGFIPGITTDFDAMRFAGHESEAKLLGLFQVSILHNVVHLLFGVVGLLAARTVSASKSYLVVGGLLYLGLWVFGLVVGEEATANFVPVNTADNWLHFALGVSMLGAGLLLGKAIDTRSQHTGTHTRA